MRAVEGVGPHLGNVGGVGAGAGEEGHEIWGGPVGYPGEDLVVNVGCDFGEGGRLEGGSRGEERAEIAWLDIG